jgi:hypothetical protein
MIKEKKKKKKEEEKKQLARREVLVVAARPCQSREISSDIKRKKRRCFPLNVPRRWKRDVSEPRYAEMC